MVGDILGSIGALIGAYYGGPVGAQAGGAIGKKISGEDKNDGLSYDTYISKFLDTKKDEIISDNKKKSSSSPSPYDTYLTKYFGQGNNYYGQGGGVYGRR
jgi:hypothetical protein